MPNHTVAQGECLSSIAAQAGFTVDTLWNLPQNAQLKQLRKDPNVLYPNDVVFIPDKRLKEIPSATEKRHPFVKKGSAAKLKIRLLDGKSISRTVVSSCGDSCRARAMHPTLRICSPNLSSLSAQARPGSLQP